MAFFPALARPCCTAFAIPLFVGGAGSDGGGQQPETAGWLPGKHIERY